MQVGNITQLTINDLNLKELQKIKHEFVRLSPESGDWEAWYLNDKLIAEGHRVETEDILDAIADILPNTYESIEISDEKAEKGFTKELKDML